MSLTTQTAAAPQPIAEATAMLDLMMRLADLLASETTMVASGHVNDIAALQREKLRLSVLYRDAIRKLDVGGVKIVGLPAPLRAQIVAASARLSDVVAQNERTLRVGRAATRKLLEMLVATLKAKLKSPIGYNARLTAARYTPALAVAIDRRL
jgi:hypothetical protein